MSKVSKVTSCQGRDLINHCRQIHRPNDLMVEYFPVREYKELEPNMELNKEWDGIKTSWVCRIKFRDHIFTECQKNKRLAFIECANHASSSLKKILIC